MSLRDRGRSQFFRVALRAFIYPTYKGGDKAIRLIIQDGERIYHEEDRTAGDSMGQLDGKVEARLRELGFEPTGDERHDVSDEWIARDGGYMRLLKRKEG